MMEYERVPGFKFQVSSSRFKVQTAEEGEGMREDGMMEERINETLSRRKMSKRSRNIAGVLLLFILIIEGCATVPKQAVELSYLVGKDLEQMHVSYRELAVSYFENLRNQANDFIDNKWKPTYLKSFIEEGQLIEKARGSKPNEVLEDVQLWAEVAIEEIEAKRKELLNPIAEDERALLGSIDESFYRIMRANATITAHLNSLREIEEVQNEVLQSLNLKDLRDKINKGLVEASDKSEKALEKLKEAMKKIEKLEKKETK